MSSRIWQDTSVLKRKTLKPTVSAAADPGLSMGASEAVIDEDTAHRTRGTETETILSMQNIRDLVEENRPLKHRVASLKLEVAAANQNISKLESHGQSSL